MNNRLYTSGTLVFTRATPARELARVGLLAVVVCLSVRLSFRLLQVGVLLKRLNVGSRKQRHTIAQESSFLLPKISAKLKRGHPNGGANCRWGRSNAGAVLKLATFDAKR